MSERELKNGAAFDKVVAKAWTDPTFKAQLLADPQATLAAAGLAIPPDVTVKVVENTDKLVHLVLPPPVAEIGLSDVELEKIAAGLRMPCGGSNQTKGSNCY